MDRIKLPEIYKSCAHPQSVWFDEHWRPIFNKLNDVIELWTQRNAELQKDRDQWKQKAIELESAYSDLKKQISVDAMFQEIEKLRAENQELKELLEDLNVILPTGLHGHHDLIQRVKEICK